MQNPGSAAIQSVGQCFHRPGIPKISFSCEDGSAIRILRAFHGLRGGAEAGAEGGGGSKDDGGLGGRHRSGTQCDRDASADSIVCSYCDGDCVDESINEVRRHVLTFAPPDDGQQGRSQEFD